MKVITHNLSTDFEELQILPLADVHLGDKNCNGNRLNELLDYIAETPNCYTILNGDLMDTATKTSIGDVYGANLNPMQQLEQCVKLFDKIKGKVLAVMPGNHEQRIYKTDGLDTTSIMCSQLGILDYYSPTSAFLFIRFGAQTRRHEERTVCYTIYCVHGSGGGRMEGGKVNRMLQLSSIVDADIYLHSHTHLPAVVKNSYYRVCLANSSIAKVDKLFVNTSSLLDYGGYGEMQSYKPNSLDTPLITLNGKRHFAKATL